MSVKAAAWRLGLFAAVIVVVLMLVITAIQRPVAGETEMHDALFADANGLKVGDDVRMYGVQVGKVKSIELEGAQARVGLSLKTDAPIYDNSKLAIRYQNLTGQRYIDLQQQPTPGTRLPADARIGTDHTVPSFDVTQLFNGLKPVLATISPEAINQFSASMVALIEGDGQGVGPAMDAIGKLASYVDNRQQVIGTLIRNMSELSDRLSGRVHYLVPLLAQLTNIFEALNENIGGLAQFAATAPSVLRPIDNLLRTLGISSGSDVDALIRKIFPDAKEAVEVFGRLPAVLAAADAALPSSPSGWKPVCSKGNAQVPGMVQVLASGQQVAICNG
ncbi:MlaD family protein [Nocardia huaxiensis]|uniref:MCE family protein n=1 Tax=Nocardia huaxiensis TaxID=2755382 RepID=A0A7D6VBX8_9NOCA|nr:MCE family protein [Nocardia huaxiensis]QLY30622.1 MCE family protein [Nocardia huaxiensis]UFS95772.1 MCE family protein [Nocardia huaxiensis]